MSRSLKKGPYISPKLLAKIKAMPISGKKEAIKTWARNSTVFPQLVGHTLLIHNGKRFIPVYITEDMVGHKLGEFASTRTFRGHGVAHGERATTLK
jgi:small subunit ribosomal protein S19